VKLVLLTISYSAILFANKLPIIGKSSSVPIPDCNSVLETRNGSLGVQLQTGKYGFPKILYLYRGKLTMNGSVW
jgi:hypothetical protein